MKLFKTFVVFFLVFNLSGYSQEKTFTFKGQVHYGDKLLKGAKIEIFEAGVLLFETYSKGGGKFEFDLKSEREYMVDISMEDLRTKTIWIKTRRTEHLKSRIPEFAFDIFLKRDKRTAYDELSEIPVTLIKYQPQKKAFYMDKTYENAVKSKKKKIKDSRGRTR